METLLGTGGQLKALVEFLFDDGGNATDEFVALIGSKLLPVGAMLFWVGPTLPQGFLLANGQAVSRTTYASLYAVIGQTHGVGDGTSTFNLPNMQDRVPMGATPKPLGETGGQDTINKVPAHSHVLFANDNGYGNPGPLDQNSYLPCRYDHAADEYNYSFAKAAAGKVPEIGKTADAGDTSVNITPKYLAGYWIIRF